MRVEPSQLVPGCMLLKDVKGKSNRAIIPKNTILTDEHIMVLEKFLVSYVDVGSKLSDGNEFKPKVIQKEKEPEKQIELSGNVKKLPFHEHYQYVVQNYKKLFKSWQNSIQIDMPEVRKLVIPLFERIDQGEVDVFNLHLYNIKKDYMYHHSVAVSILSAFLGKKMGYSSGDFVQIGLAGFLSDCGMAKVSPIILNKTVDLSENELIEMKNHPTYSYRMVQHIPTITQVVKLAILQHHERLDGSGYPLGVQKDKIHAYAKIVAVSDMYHAMTCERLYQAKKSPFQAIEELSRFKYTHYDYEVVELFMKNIANFTVGTKVRLSNGKTGQIVFIENNFPTRPMVQVNNSNEIVTLKNNSAISIDEIV
ncbi:HD domain-containing phosphohydrolase [Virgibacillus sp. DJP39]|uniref:HD domain-containing phosphohydrolase n=1 Tax=Virgibacillus sp. DJP39 TaxID=3409790 RepID=UPI003BB7AEB4